MNIKKRAKKGFITGIIGTIVNFVLAGIKLYVGIHSGSLSILSDSFNNFTDAIMSSTVSGSMYLTSKKKNTKYNCGYGRVEYIISFIMAIIMLILGLIFIIQAIDKLFALEIEKFNWLFIYFLIASIIAKICLAIFYRIQNKKLKSIAIKTMELDSYQDSVITTATLTSLVLVRYTNIRVDLIVTMIIALIIMFNGAKILSSVYKPLVSCKNQNLKFSDSFAKFIFNNHKNILCFNDFLIFDYGNSEKYVTMDVYYDNNNDIEFIQKDLNKLMKECDEKYNLKLTANAKLTDNILKSNLQKLFNNENIDINISELKVQGKELFLALNFPNNYEITHKLLMEKINTVINNNYKVNITVNYD